VQAKSSKWISQTCLSRKPFGLSTNFSDFKNSGVKCICQGQEVKFVDPTTFTDKNGIIGKWKVVTGKVTSEGNIKESSNGSLGVLTNFFIIEPSNICLETYVVVNTFDTKDQAENFISFMKTKIFRFLLSLRVSGIDINQDKFAFVPDMLDYSVPYSDKTLGRSKGLYDIFGLTRQEIAYIESKIKAI
jgi:site-specific DNA-methyltransferase (adenine-specific)